LESDERNDAVSEPPEPRIRVSATFETEWPGASALATECVLNLAYLAERLTAIGQVVVRRHGIPSVAAFNVLTVVDGAGEPLPPSVIAERMVVSRPTMTGTLGTLERRGLIRRLPHASDGRMALIDITPGGRDRMLAMRRELHQYELRWMACLDVAEQTLLLRLIGALQANEPGR